MMGPLRRGADPRYFETPAGDRVVLAGSHTWDTVQDFRLSEGAPRFDFDSWVAFLVRYGHNFTRLWRWEYNLWVNPFLGAQQNVEPHPWPRPNLPGPRAGDGLWKFDLDAQDPAYLQRLDERLTALEAHGIYASVMLFEGCISAQSTVDHWPWHPFNPANNLQGIGSTLAACYSLEDPRVVQAQEGYVYALVRALNGHRNLLWEISNETMASSYPWQLHMMELVRNIEAVMPNQHPVGLTTMVRGGTDEQLVNSPADWISPGMANYKDPSFPNTTGKVVLLDTDHLWGLGGDAEWVHKAAANGYNPIFMDPYLGNVVPGTWNGGNPGTWEAVRDALGEVATDTPPEPPTPPTGESIVVVPDVGVGPLPVGCTVLLPGSPTAIVHLGVNDQDGARRWVGLTAAGGGVYSGSIVLPVGTYTYQAEVREGGNPVRFVNPTPGSKIVVRKEEQEEQSWAMRLVRRGATLSIVNQDGESLVVGTLE